MSENDLNYEPAGAGIRFCAAVVDGLILGVVNWVITFPIMFIGIMLVDDPEGSASVGLQFLSTILNWIVGGFYVGYFLSKKGATPGKTVFKLKVLHSETGAYLSAGRAIGREFIGKTVCVLTLFIGFLLVIFRADKRGLHDLMFKSRVVRRK